MNCAVARVPSLVCRGVLSQCFGVLCMNCVGMLRTLLILQPRTKARMALVLVIKSPVLARATWSIDLRWVIGVSPKVQFHAMDHHVVEAAAVKGKH